MTSACLIIDDPRLCKTYGYLNYSKLLFQMKEHNFFTEIAYIPFNYNFFCRNTIKLFADNPEYFGLCVHGFDHTSNEFGITDYEKLSKKAETSLWRMNQFSRKTGLTYDRVIVFPQGKFSSVAMKALKEVGYFAAFNSTISATDTGEPPQKEYLKPYTEHYNLPLFLRRYPSDKKGILQDLNNGRPIIIVEHHTAFKNSELFDTIDWINSLGDIQWRDLSYIVEEICQLKASYGNLSPQKKANSSFKSIMRRFACEIRDNFIQTNPYLSRLYDSIRYRKTCKNK